MQVKNALVLELTNVDLQTPTAPNLVNGIGIIRFMDQTTEEQFLASKFYLALKPLMTSDCLVIYNNSK